MVLDLHDWTTEHVVVVMGRYHGDRCVSEPGLVFVFRIVSSASSKDASFQNHADVILGILYSSPSSPCKAISSRNATRASRPPSMVDRRTCDQTSPVKMVHNHLAPQAKPCRSFEQVNRKGPLQPHAWTDAFEKMVVGKAQPLRCRGGSK